MENILNVVYTIVVVALGWYLVIFKGSIKKYLDEKAKNLATREDISTITTRVEEIKTDFGRRLESYKHGLQYNLQIDTNAIIAFQQKVREALDKVNSVVVEVQVYCWDSQARIGGSEHYISLADIQCNPEEASAPASFWYFRSKLDRLAITESLYLPDAVIQSVKDLAESCGNLGAAEFADQTGAIPPEMNDLAAVYDHGLERAKECQRAIREELRVRPSATETATPE